MLNEDGSVSVTNEDGDAYALVSLEDRGILIGFFDNSPSHNVSVELAFTQDELKQYVANLQTFIK